MQCILYAWYVKTYCAKAYGCNSLKLYKGLLYFFVIYYKKFNFVHVYRKDSIHFWRITSTYYNFDISYCIPNVLSSMHFI